MIGLLKKLFKKKEQFVTWDIDSDIPPTGLSDCGDYAFFVIAGRYELTYNWETFAYFPVDSSAIQQMTGAVISHRLRLAQMKNPSAKKDRGAGV